MHYYLYTESLFDIEGIGGIFLLLSFILKFDIAVVLMNS